MNPRDELVFGVALGANQGMAPGSRQSGELGLDLM
jgi:hypothetical protein